MINKLLFNPVVIDGAHREKYELRLKGTEQKDFEIVISQLKYFSQLTNILGEINFLKILNDVPNAVESKYFPGNYLSSDKLPLFFYLPDKNQTLIVISYGEIQPARYRLVVEGVWQINN